MPSRPVPSSLQMRPAITCIVQEGELSSKVGDVGNRQGGILWGCLTSPPKERYAVPNDNVIKLIQPGEFEVVGRAVTHSTT